MTMLLKRCQQCVMLLAALAFSAKAVAPLDVRIALVIGNGAYTRAPRLENTGNDATAIAKSLRGLGFTVEELRDGNRAQMVEALEKVRKGLQGQQALGMLYYAGHGVQVDWHNYLIPVDVRLSKASDLPLQALDVDAVVDVFKGAGTRMNILVLDACRDNPFMKSGSTGKGLAPMDAPPGTLLAYATQPGNVAEDGDVEGSNGPYAEFLQVELLRPFARVEDVFKRVRYQVRQKTEGRQIPWESTSLEEDFVFNNGTRGLTSSSELERLAQEAKRREQELVQQASQARERERRLSETIEAQRQAKAAAEKIDAQLRLEEAAKIAAAQTLAAATREAEQRRINLEAKRRQEESAAREAQALQRERQLAAEQTKEQEQKRQVEKALMETRAVEVQRAQLAAELSEEMKRREELKRLPKERQQEQIFAVEKADWDRIRDSKTAQDVYFYLYKYPNGSVSELAQAKIEQLDKPKIQPVADRSGQVQPFEAKRFALGDRYEFVVRDFLTKLEIERPVFSVVKMDADAVEFNQGYKVTQSGAIIRTIAGATLDPYQQWIPSGEYQIGKKWHTRSVMTLKNGQSIWVDLNGKVVARETIVVPAGSFDAYRMEIEQTAQDGTSLKITYWGQPEWGVAIKQIRELRDRGGYHSGQIYEMVSRKRGG